MPTIDQAKVDQLLARVRRDVDEGLAPAVSVAVAYQGEVVVEATYGAPEGSRFVGFSATKALVAGAIWRLLDQGTVSIHEPVATYIDEFATNGKEAVTVEHLLTHTGGFPWAPLGPDRWGTSQGRREMFARWRLTLDPGTTFVYHPTAGHWVLGEILATVTGMDHADAIEELVTAPLGLPRLLAIAPEDQGDVIDAVGVGAPPTPEEMEEAFGFKVDISALIPPDVALNALLTLNDPQARAVGVPGGGGIFRARDLAMLYQGFLHDPDGLWSDEAIEQGTRNVRMTLPDMPAGLRRSRFGPVRGVPDRRDGPAPDPPEPARHRHRQLGGGDPQPLISVVREGVAGMAHCELP